MREEYLRLTRKTGNRLIKSVLVDELLNNSDIGELFGINENLAPNLIWETIENIGAEDSLNIDEFLQFYQISKNNLLRSKQVFVSENAKNQKIPKIKVKLEYLFEKFLEEAEDNNSKEEFVLLLKTNFDKDISEILQIPPIIYTTLDEFINSLLSSEEALSLKFLISLFTIPEVLDFILPESLLTTIEQIYNSLPLEPEGFVNTLDLIDKLFENETIQSNLQTIARSSQGLKTIPDENLKTLLERIQTEAPQ